MNPAPSRLPALAHAALVINPAHRSTEHVAFASHDSFPRLDTDSMCEWRQVRVDRTGEPDWTRDQVTVRSSRD